MTELDKLREALDKQSHQSQVPTYDAYQYEEMRRDRDAEKERAETLTQQKHDLEAVIAKQELELDDVRFELAAEKARADELLAAERSARQQENVGNKGDADAIRRDAIREFLGIKICETLAHLARRTEGET